jgi:hypothetical protein
MRVQFSTVEEFLEELGLDTDAPVAMAPRILRLTCMYTRCRRRHCVPRSGRVLS